MNNKILKLAALMVMLSPMTANAGPVVLDANCVNSGDLCVSGIDGLNVLGMTLDVTFLSGAYDSIFAANTPFFLGDEGGANAAAAEIAALLDGVYFGVIGDGERGSFEFDDLILINTELTADDTFGATILNDVVGTGWTAVSAPSQQVRPPFFDLSLLQPDNFVAWAVFTPAAVPEPGTLALLGLGLAGMGFNRRRKR